MNNPNAQGHESDPITGLHVSVGKSSTGTAKVFELLRTYLEARDFSALADDDNATGSKARAEAWVDESWKELDAAILKLAYREPVRLTEDDFSEIATKANAHWMNRKDYMRFARDAQEAVLKANGLVP